jgi:predicted ATP-dependent endonuclease of OLD family
MLPIALKSFHIIKYRGIEDTKVDNIPPDTQWIFLTGENGFGKTSVLLNIAQRLFAEGQRTITLGKAYTDSETKYEYYVRGKGVTWQNSFNKSQFNIGKVFLAYGSSRLRTANGISRESNSFDSNLPFSSLMNTDTLLYDIEQLLIDSNAYKKDLFIKLESIFKDLIPNLRKIEIEAIDTEPIVVKYYEQDDKGSPYDKGVNFVHLASGYKNIIAMVGDMIIRLRRYQNVENFKDLFGIVLIDEIDLHLHPKYQKQFVQKLTELFPKIQFIVSTHSPIPLLGAPKNSVIINVSRTREEGIKAELLDIDFSVLTPNAILSSPIFGFQDLIPESKSDDKMIRTEDTFQEVEFNDQLKKNINEFLTEDRQKELLNLLKIKAL